MKKSKLFKFLGLSIISATATIAPIVVITSCANEIKLKENYSELFKNNTSADTKGYIYENKYFDNIDDLVDDYLFNHQNIISSDFYLGNLENAIVDSTTGLVNPNFLNKYNPNNLYPVYLNALGNPTPNFKEAKNSYINKGLIRIKYYDFNNNIFDTYAQAKESIIKSKNSLGVQYYNNIELSNTNSISKFNPLSLQDLNEFKKLVFNEVVKQLNNSSNSSNIKLKIYDKSYKYNNQYLLSSLYSDKIYNKDFINNIVNYCVQSYFDTKWNMLKNDMLFDVNLVIDESEFVQKDLDYWAKYDFENFNNKYLKYDIRLIDNKTIKFNNVNFYDLKQFNKFVNRSEFRNSFNRSIKKHWLGFENHALCWDVAEEFQIDFLGAEFKLAFKGNSDGSKGGIDFQVLENGSNDTKLKFKLKITTKLKNSYYSFNELFKNKYNLLFNNNMSHLNPNSIVGILYNLINNQVFNNLYYSDTSNNPNLFDVYYNTPAPIDQKSDSNEITNLNLNDVSQNYFLMGGLKFNDSFSYLLDEGQANLYVNSFSTCHQSGESKNGKKSPINNISIDTNVLDHTQTSLKNLYLNQNIININQIENILLNFLNSFCWVIDYNNAPIFKFKMDIKNFENNIKLLNHNSNSLKFDFNIHKILQYSNFKSEISKNNLNQIQKNILNNFTNVSQSFKFENDWRTNTKYNVIFEDKNLFYFDNNTNLIFNYQNDLNKNYFESDSSIIPQLTKNSVQYPLSSIVKTYNNIVDFVKKQSGSSTNEILSKSLVDPKDILILYNNQSTPKTTTYSAFLSNGQYVSPSLINNDSISLYKTRLEIENAINANMFVEPAQIVVVYDLLGNVINPGVKIDVDENLSSSSDAIFDPENVVVENILRTKIVPQDSTKRYYKDEFGNYHLVDYKIHQIYKLNLENKDYYYRSHYYLINALKSYLELNSERVEK